MSQRERRDRIFISYRRSDSAGHAGRLKDDLARVLGDRLFMDVSGIAPGADFERVLREELASCGAVLAVIGANWREAFDAPREGHDYVRIELAQALSTDGLHVVPVLMQGAGLPAAGQLPPDLQSLARRQAVVIRDDRWQDDVANLARELRRALKLSRVPVRWLAAGAIVLVAIALWIKLSAPPPPEAFLRARAHQITAAATGKAAVECKLAKGVARECPVVFQFAPDGSARNVYFDSGSCILKAPPFGECVLQRLAKVRIPPFDDLTSAEVSLNLRVDASGSVKVMVDQ